MLHCSLGTFLSFSFLHPTPRILFRPSNASFVRASVLPPSLLLLHCCASLPLLPSLLCSPARSTFSVTPALSFRRARVARCDSPPSRASRPCSRPCSCALPRSLPPYLSLTHLLCFPRIPHPSPSLLCALVLTCVLATSLTPLRVFFNTKLLPSRAYASLGWYRPDPDAPWGGSCLHKCQRFVFKLSSLLYSHCPPLVRVGLCGHKGALPCRGEHGPHRPTRTHTSCRRLEQPPNRPVHACEPPRAHAAFGKMP